VHFSRRCASAHPVASCRPSHSPLRHAGATSVMHLLTMALSSAKRSPGPRRPTVSYASELTFSGGSQAEFELHDLRRRGETLKSAAAIRHGSRQRRRSRHSRGPE
jgi:hypothetical protein